MGEAGRMIKVVYREPCRCFSPRLTRQQPDQPITSTSSRVPDRDDKDRGGPDESACRWLDCKRCDPRWARSRCLAFLACPGSSFSTLASKPSDHHQPSLCKSSSSCFDHHSTMRHSVPVLTLF